MNIRFLAFVWSDIINISVFVIKRFLNIDNELMLIKNILIKYGLILFLGCYFLILVYRINSVYLVIGDEQKYAHSITALLDGSIDSNGHPLLAKTVSYFILYLSYILLGRDYAVYWRLGTILFSLGTLIIFYKILSLYFSKSLAFMGVALLALDPLYFSFSRIINLDTAALFFSLWALYWLLLLLKKEINNYWYLAALCFGLSIACKFSILMVAISIPLFFLLAAKNKIHYLLARRLIYLRYYLILISGFILGNGIFFFKDHHGVSFLSYVYDIFRTHFTLSIVNTGFQISPAWSWFTVPQMLILYRLDWINTAETIAAFQNPILFFLSLITILMTIFMIIKKDSPNTKVILLVLYFFFIQYLPWFFNIHTVYYYYILPLLPLVIFLFINLLQLSFLKKYKKLIILAVLVISTLIFTAVYPLLTARRISVKYEKFIRSYSLYRYPYVDTFYCQKCSTN